MAAAAQQFDLAGLRLSPGEGRRLRLEVPIEPIVLGGERYVAEPGEGGAVGLPLELTVSRMSGGGYALRLRMSTSAAGSCMRCLKPARVSVEVDALEVDQPGDGEELDSPYVHDETLELSAWAHDAFALAIPAKVLCRADCPGLCPVCAVDLTEAGPDHRHQPEPDPRWAKLRELRLE